MPHLSSSRPPVIFPLFFHVLCLIQPLFGLYLWTNTMLSFHSLSTSPCLLDNYHCASRFNLWHHRCLPQSTACGVIHHLVSSLWLHCGFGVCIGLCCCFAAQYHTLLSTSFQMQECVAVQEELLLALLNE